MIVIMRYLIVIVIGLKLVDDDNRNDRMIMIIINKGATSLGIKKTMPYGDTRLEA